MGCSPSLDSCSVVEDEKLSAAEASSLDVLAIAVVVDVVGLVRL